MSIIKLNFINESADTNNTPIVLFYKSNNANADLIAWKVIENCGNGDNHPFAYDLQNKIVAGDSWGNFSPKLDASVGQAFIMKNETSGNVMKNDGATGNPYQIALKNDLELGAISANIFNNESLLFRMKGIVPQQKAVFEFKPTLFIAAIPYAVEGEVINTDFLPNAKAQINLQGMESADIVMSGGGSGAKATAFTFAIKNPNSGSSNSENAEEIIPSNGTTENSETAIPTDPIHLSE